MNVRRPQVADADLQFATVTVRTAQKMGVDSFEQATGLGFDRIMELLEFRTNATIGRCYCCLEGEMDGLKIFRCSRCDQAYCACRTRAHAESLDCSKACQRAYFDRRADDADRYRDWATHKRYCADFAKIRDVNRAHNGACDRALDALSTFIAARRKTYELVSRIAISDRLPGDGEPLLGTSAGLVITYEYRDARPDDPIRVRSITCETVTDVLQRPDFVGGDNLAYYQRRAKILGHRRPILGASLIRIMISGRAVEVIPQIGVQAVGEPATITIGETRLRRGGYDLAAALNENAFGAAAERTRTAALELDISYGGEDIRTALMQWGQHHRHILDDGSIRESATLDRDEHAKRSLIIHVECVFGTLDVGRSFKPVRFDALSLDRAHDRLGISSDDMDDRMEVWQTMMEPGKLQQIVFIALVGDAKAFAPMATVTDCHAVGPDGLISLTADQSRSVEAYILESKRASSAGWFDALKRACV